MTLELRMSLAMSGVQKYLSVVAGIVVIHVPVQAKQMLAYRTLTADASATAAGKQSPSRYQKLSQPCSCGQAARQQQAQVCSGVSLTSILTIN